MVGKMPNFFFEPFPKNKTAFNGLFLKIFNRKSCDTPQYFLGVILNFWHGNNVSDK